MKQRGNLFILSGPSGVGKGTVRKALFKRHSDNLIYSISATTRQPRQKEVDGVDYFFTDKKSFESMIENGELLEYAQYVDNFYGTPKKSIEEQRDLGKDVFVEIEVNGAMQVRAKVPDAIFIFLLPPDLDQLKNRLILRGTEDDSVINERLSTARQEIRMMTNYDFAVVNDKVEEAVKKIEMIIKVARLKANTVAAEYTKILEE